MKRILLIAAVLGIPMWMHAQVPTPPPPPPPAPVDAPNAPEATVHIEEESVTITTAGGDVYIIDDYGVRRNGVMIAGDTEGLVEEIDELQEEIDQLNMRTSNLDPNSEEYEELMDELDDLEEELADMNADMFYPDTIPGDSTALTVGNWRLIVKETGEDAESVDIDIDRITEEVDDRYVDPFETYWWLFDMGYNMYLNENNEYDVPAPYEQLEEQQFWGSFDVNLHVFRSRVNIAKGYLNFNYGLSLEWHHFRYDDNFRIMPDTNMLVIVNEETIDFEKNKFNTMHVAAPLLIGFETKPWDTENSFRMQFGYSPGFMLRGKTKYKYDGEKEIEKDDFNLSPIRHEVNYIIGYGDFNLYASYDLNPMFETNKGPELHPFSVGIVLRKGF